MRGQRQMKLNYLLILLAALSLTFLTACPSPEANTARNGANTNTVNKMNTNTASSPMTATSPAAETNPMVGGAPMLASKDIIENASNSKDHTTLVAAVKAADLVDTLKGAGPFTVFAPTNAAFEKLPAGTVDTLLKPENKEKLQGVLTYHVVAGKQDAAAIAKAIKDGNGKAGFKTVQGEELTASMDGDKVVLTDAKGGKSIVTIADVMQSNGVIHVVDTVLMPK